MAKDNKVFTIGNIRVTQEDIDGIMACALEGGITYWCDRVDVVGGEYLGEYANEQISRGGELKLSAIEDDEYVLNLPKLLKGVEMFYKVNPEDCMFVKRDAGHIEIFWLFVDGERSDAIVQFALFDEIVFG